MNSDMNNREKFLSLVSKDETDTLKWAKEEQALMEADLFSKKIAIRILHRLDSLGLKQVDLAEKMGVSRQQVNKWVKGNENFTIETLINIGRALGTDLIQLAPLNNTIKVGRNKLSLTTNYEKNAKSISFTSKNVVMESSSNYKKQNIQK